MVVMADEPKRTRADIFAMPDGFMPLPEVEPKPQPIIVYRTPYVPKGPDPVKVQERRERQAARLKAVADMREEAARLEEIARVNAELAAQIKHETSRKVTVERTGLPIVTTPHLERIYVPGREERAHLEIANAMKTMRADAICARIAQGAYPWVAAVAEGVQKSVFYAWMDETVKKGEPYKTFRARINSAMAEARSSAETRIHANNPALWLTKGPGRERMNTTDEGWSDKQATVNVGVQSVTINNATQINLSALSDEELDQLEALTKKTLQLPANVGTAHEGDALGDVLDATFTEVVADIAEDALDMVEGDDRE